MFVLAACQGEEMQPQPQPSQSEANPFGGERVSFPAGDGASIVGAVFGEGEVAVALAHMGRQGDDATDWTATAGALAEQGVRVLIFNRRGICTTAEGGESVCSDGDGGPAESWQDVVGAVQYLHSTGAQTVVAGGASLGAMASLSAATREPAGIDALVWFAGILNGAYSFTEQAVQNVEIPAFLASTTGDTVGAAGDAQTLAGWLPRPTDLVLLQGSTTGPTSSRSRIPRSVTSSRRTRRVPRHHQLIRPGVDETGNPRAATHSARQRNQLGCIVAVLQHLRFVLIGRRPDVQDDEVRRFDPHYRRFGASVSVVGAQAAAMIVAMFRSDERERLRDALVSRAVTDDRITGAAVTGSAAVGREDRWSDIDLALCVASDGDLGEVIADWTDCMYQAHEAVHHVDVTWGATVFRVFLLASTLQVDLAFWPAAEFGATAPTFRLLFGTANDRPTPPAHTAAELIGMGWLYALHARSSIERGRVWQAEYMISGVRDHVLALACLRHGLPASEGRGMDSLPPDATAAIAGSLVRSLDLAELRRGFRVASEALLIEVGQVDTALLSRLAGPLAELADIAPSARLV